MTLALRHFRNKSDIQACADIYLEMNDESFIPSHRQSAINNLGLNIRAGNPARIIMMNDIIVGFILAEFSKLEYTNLNILANKFYVSNLKGFASASAVWLAHTYLITTAETHRCPLVMSQCSPFDTQLLLCRLLQKKGWETRGHTAIYKTKYFK